MLVRNYTGSSRWTAPQEYSSWLSYWEAMTGKRATLCGKTGCFGTDLVGAHVQKVNSTDKHVYITPLCRSCNGLSGSFEVSSQLVPVPSNL